MTTPLEAGDAPRDRALGGRGNSMRRTADAERAGLQHRYDIERVSDPKGRHDECRYFVLDPNHDPIAEVALRVYADEAKRQGYGVLADDLLDWIGRCPIYGAKPHGPHTWTDIGIGGETEASCDGAADRQ